ncbi:MAG: alpha/beta hydrolase-fold protein, partial [Oscillospiraceae bacterium]|nr:alpha/beta hydrolase-fold protein [Oscillospiraceae bacterium]
MATIQAEFTSDCLKRTVNFNAVLPTDPMFPGAFRAPLKTAYLLHGFSGSADDWFTRHALGNISLMNNLAIILPSAENHFYVDDMQCDDFYGEFIGRELVEFTRRMLPLSDKCEDTIIGGISMGGYGALRNGMKYNDVFGHVIGISAAIILKEIVAGTYRPSLPGLQRGFYESVFGDFNTALERDVDVFWLAKKLKDEGTEFPNMYFACGSNDKLVYENRRFHEHLAKLG